MTTPAAPQDLTTISETKDGTFYLYWPDYVVLGVLLLLSITIGVLVRWADRNRKSADDFLLAGKDMSCFPIAASLFMSGTSAVILLKDPVEVYQHGIVYWMIGVGQVMAIPVIAHLFANLYHLMELSTAYQFLEIRFAPVLRPLCSVIYGICVMLYLGVVLCAPAVVLSQVKALPGWLSILIIGVVCLIYTSLGGLRGVVWVDTLHMFIMLAGLLAVLIQGCFSLGGIANVWRKADQGGRIDFTSVFGPDPLARSTFWTYLFGGFFRVLAMYSSEQFAIQRYSAARSSGHVISAVYMNIPLFAIFTSLYALIGLVMYVHFQDCDPLNSGHIDRVDQMLPLLAVQLLVHIPGVCGLFAAAVICASLGAVSSGQLSVATILLHDIIMPQYKRHYNMDLNTESADLLAKVLTPVMGVLTIGVAYAVYFLSDVPYFMDVTWTVLLLLGPIAGIFIVGALFRFVNAACVAAGALCCLAITLFLGIGSIFFPPYPPSLPVSTTGCHAQNTTMLPSGTTSVFLPTTATVDNSSQPTESGGFSFGDVFSLSPLLYPALGPLLTSLLSLLFASCYILCCRKEETEGAQDASEEFETEGFCVERDTAYRSRMGYNEVPHRDTQNTGDGPHVPPEQLPIFAREETETKA